MHNLIMDLLHEAHLLSKRLRGLPVITKHGAWAQSNPVFGRCHWCGHMTLRGICQTCGSHVECAWCGRIKLPDGTFTVVHCDEDEPNVSHGICPECKARAIASVKKRKVQVELRRPETNRISVNIKEVYV